MMQSTELPNDMTFLTNVFMPKLLNTALVSLLAVALPSFSFLVGIIEQYIWSPASLILILAATIFGEVITGATKAIKIKKETFSFKKSTRSIYIFGAHCFVLMILHNTAQAYPVLEYVAQAVFMWFILRNLTSIVEDMISLQWIRADFLDFFKAKIKKINEPTEDKIPD